MPYQDPPTHEPTPDEIRQRCLEIQLGWTRQTERSRRVYPGCKATEPWQPQQIAFPIGVEVWVAERLLGVAAYEFEGWLRP